MTRPPSLVLNRASTPRPIGFERPVTLSEVLDRLLNKGVVVAGEVVISVANVDLVYLAVNVTLTSIETARQSTILRKTA